MEEAKKIKELLLEQKKILEAVEIETNLLLKTDSATEIQQLQATIATLENKVKNYNAQLSKVTQQNSQLKNALHDKIYNEKKAILKTSKDKVDRYFGTGIAGELNQLTLLEQDLTQKSSMLLKQLHNDRIKIGKELYQQIHLFQQEVQATVAKEKDRLVAEQHLFQTAQQTQYNHLQATEVTEKDYTTIGKKINMEDFVGRNLINKLGIFFVLLGLIAISQFTFVRLDNTFKGIMMFLISGIFLAGGEFFNRRKPTLFSIGLTGGGVAGLYISLSVSYFYLDILSMYPALLLSILITSCAFVLSQRYDAQTIGVFALIGGYLPMVSIGQSVTLVYGALFYFLILNILSLGISFYKKWIINQWVGFVFNLFGTIYIVLLLDRFSGSVVGVERIISILYVLFSFLTYMVIPILGNHRNRNCFSFSDIFLLGANAFLSALMLYSIFYWYDLTSLNGILTIVLAMVYLALAQWIQHRWEEEKNIVPLFYITGLTFVVLVIPFQFGRQWLSLGWLVQGVSVITYGIVKERKTFMRAGGIISALCLAAFCLFDVMSQGDLFPYKYFAITLGSLVVLGAYAYKDQLEAPFIQWFQGLSLLNVWIYCCYVVYLGKPLFELITGDASLSLSFLWGALTIAVTFLYAFVITKIPYIQNQTTETVSYGISSFGLFLLFVVTQITKFVMTTPSVGVLFVGTIIILGLSLAALWNSYRLLQFFYEEADFSFGWVPFGVSIYGLIILTQNLIIQYGLTANSILLSILYVVASLIWILYGFTKKLGFVRRFGLGLSIMAVAKLFLVDLIYLSQGFKIISYFAFGITLLGISFAYQYFAKKLSDQGEDQ